MALRRGASNSNARGSSYARRIRKQWLCDTYGDGTGAPCYSCGDWLPYGPRLEADRIIPGALGGTYMRSNIRPACSPCNIRAGNNVQDLLAVSEDPEVIIWMSIRGEL